MRLFRKRRNLGFTLVEVMMVVAIIGLLASVAIPSGQIVLLRVKAAERKRMEQQMFQRVLEFLKDDRSTTSDWTYLPMNPPAPPDGSAQKMLGYCVAGAPAGSRSAPPNCLPGGAWTTAPGGMPLLTWNDIPIEGNTYYRFEIWTWRNAGGTQFWIHSLADLDRNGTISDRWYQGMATSGGTFMTWENTWPSEAEL